MTKKQLVEETLKQLETLNASVVRPMEVEVSLYKGCEKIGYTKMVWCLDGRIFCIAKLFDGGLQTFTDNQLNSGNINRIYQYLKNEYERE